MGKQKKVRVLVSYQYELVINEDHHIVQEYKNDEELIRDCAGYRFGTGLPVIHEGGVDIKDVELFMLDDIKYHD